MAELVSQTATLRCPCALLPAIIGCDVFAAHGAVCEPCLPLPACCHLLLLPNTSAAAACLRKPGQRSLGFGGHPGEDSEQSVPWPVWSLSGARRCLVYTWRKSHCGSDQGCNEWEQPRLLYAEASLFLITINF